MSFTYLRVPRLVAFFLTTALSISACGLAAWGLSHGIDQENLVKKSIPGGSLDISDILGAGGAMIAAAGLASLLCLVLAFLTVFHSQKEETLTSVRIKEGVFAFCSVFYFSTLVAATDIMANRSGKVTVPGYPAAVIAQIVSASGQDLRYKTQISVKSWVIVGWIAWLATVISLVLVSLAARHVLSISGNRSTIATAERDSTHEKKGIVDNAA